MKRILALDFGLKRTGVAITDENNIIAYGLTTVNSIDLMEFLENTVVEKSIGIIVIGDPKRLDMSASHTTENVRLLKEVLVEKFPTILVELMDERFTSKLALQSLHLGGASKKDKKNKALVDEVSATIILQSYMQQLEGI
jgi:putative holliday junction resolvase